MGATVFGLRETGSTLGALRVLVLCALALSALGGCAAGLSQAPTERRAPLATRPPARSDLPPWLRPHLEEAHARLLDRGLALPRGLTVVVHEEPGEFRTATGQGELALRAWTTFERVHLLHPRHWGDDSPATRTARLTHELCHAALLHHFVDMDAAVAARIPRFFTEGACSVVAGQERLALVLVIAASRGALPLTIDAFARDPELAYGASHALALELERAHGPRVFATVMEAAATDGAAGCVERALLKLTGARDVPALWQRVVDSAVDSVPSPP